MTLPRVALRGHDLSGKQRGGGVWDFARLGEGFLCNARWNQSMGVRLGFMYTQGRLSVCYKVYRLYVYTGRHFTDQDS